MDILKAQRTLVTRCKSAIQLIPEWQFDETHWDKNPALIIVIDDALRTLCIFSETSEIGVTLVENEDINFFLDYCELRLLTNIHTNLNLTDVSAGGLNEKLNQIVKRIEVAIDKKTKFMKDTYDQWGEQTMTYDYLNHDIDSQQDDLCFML